MSAWWPGNRSTHGYVDNEFALDRPRVTVNKNNGE